MPDFLPNTRSLTIAEIVALTRAEPGPGVALDASISDIAPLDSGSASDISFWDNPKYLGALATTRGGACLVMPRFAKTAPAGLAVLVTPQPYRAVVTVARALFPDALRPSSLFGTAGRAAEAHVHPSARLEAGVTIEPLAVIGPDSEIGTGTLIAAGAAVGKSVAIGRDCVIGSGTTVAHALVGDRVIVHPGARIGQDGFGYVPSAAGHLKEPP